MINFVTESLSISY